MNVGYFPGCSLTGTSMEYDASLREVMRELGASLEEIDDWSCCGASSAHASSHLLAMALPARNVVLASKQGLEEVVAPCAACYSRLVTSQHEVAHDAQLKQRVEEVLEEAYTDGVRVMNIIELFQQFGLDLLKSRVKDDISFLKAACYYGCLLVRPHEVTKFDDPEMPTSMEALVAATGAKSVEWNFKTECCGGSHSITNTEIVTTLCKKIIDDAQKHGANVIVVACPMCHSNLDMRQRTIRAKQPDHRSIPILYITELIGMAFGVDRKKLGLDKHFIEPAFDAMQKEAV